MAKHLSQHVIGYVVASILFACAACAANVGEPGADDDPSAQLAAASSAAALAAEQVAPDDLSNPLPGVKNLDSEDLVSIEKVRNGISLSGTDTGTRGIVKILNSRGLCSAQVINKYFLLTAAHCIAELLPNAGSGDIAVFYTKTNANSPTKIYDGVAAGVAEPNWHLDYQDTGVIMLRTGMTTCHGTVTQCSANTPNNAVFQYFVPGSQRYLLSSYAFAGYGALNDTTPSPGNLYGSRTNVSSSDFANNNNGYQTFASYKNDLARACKGDSGSPLIVGIGSRVVHLGIASQGLEGKCEPAVGWTSYSGLSQYQANWLLNFMQFAKTQNHLTFDCAGSADIVNGLFLFGCDNDGSLY